MTAHATAPSGSARSELIPYVYGSAPGRPSKGRPEKVLDRLKAIDEIRQEGPVSGEDGRAGRVTARNAVPGGTSRNGLPERRGYVYRGNGKDTLTPSSVMAAWKRKEARRQDCCGAPRPDHFSTCETAAALLAGLEEAGGLMAPTPAAAPGRAAPRPERPQSRALDNRPDSEPDSEPDKRAPEIEYPQAGDTGRPDSPAHSDRTAVPSPGASGSARIENAPERCGKCEYLTTAPGHLIMCGDG